MNATEALFVIKGIDGILAVVQDLPELKARYDALKGTLTTLALEKRDPTDAEWAALDGDAANALDVIDAAAKALTAGPT